MIHHRVTQNEEAWHRLRMSIPTASCFAKIITPKTGKPTEGETPDLYACELLAAWMMDRPITGPETDFMQQGHELEDSAVEHYEFTTGIETDLGGFVTTNDGMCGCSPDRLVGDDRLLEIKSHPGNPGIHVQFMRGSALEIKHRPQLQGALWICERNQIDIISYHPELVPVIVPVMRDEEYIEKLSAAVRLFIDRLIAAKTELDQRYGISERLAEMRKRREGNNEAVDTQFDISDEDIDRVWARAQRENG